MCVSIGPESCLFICPPLCLREWVWGVTGHLNLCVCVCVCVCQNSEGSVPITSSASSALRMWVTSSVQSSSAQEERSSLGYQRRSEERTQTNFSVPFSTHRP